MHFDDSFYLDEVTEGFYVPTQVKAAWGAQLDVLLEVDKICCRHNIDYYADWGTLLGAIRHAGYVPWDDDLDICMKRSDYNTFMQYAKDELPKGFTIMDFKNREGHLFFVSRITTNSHICFEPEHLNNFHGFPYLAGLDLFILDNVDKDREAQRARAKKAEFIITSADAIAEGKIKGAELHKCLSICEDYAGMSIDRSLSGEKLRIRMYELAEVIFAMVQDEDSDALVQMMPYGMYKKELYLDRKWFRQSVRLPFMNTTISVPIDYDAVMRKCYGNYIQVNRDFGGHDYPFFMGQHREFVAQLDFDYPEYRAKAADVAEAADAVKADCGDCDYTSDKITQSGSYKNSIANSLRELDKVIERICDAPRGEVVSLCGNAQDLAVEIGNLTESVKGEGNKAVGCLEQLCERIFEVYESVINEDENDFSGVDAQVIRNLQDALKSVQSAVKKYVTGRKDVVFLPASAKHFAYMKTMYDRAVSDENTDVYVIPVPFYYKNYDGSLRDIQYDLSEYEKMFETIERIDGRLPFKPDMHDYREVNLQLMHPDMIVIATPFDEWDTIVSVDPKFYSSKLKNYTSDLVLVQHFKVTEFKKENWPEYHNMKYYVNMPGVINANRVLVQDEWMKNLYVSKLMEFIPDADDDLRHSLEVTITPDSVIFEEADALLSEEIAADYPKEWSTILENKGKKKIVLYVTGLSEIDERGMDAIEKIKRNLQTFSEAKDSIILLWQLQNPIEEFATKLDKNVADELMDIIDNCRKVDYILIDNCCDAKSKRRNEIICDAYYGDPSDVARMFVVMGKPVLIQNIDI